jgi:hypothetical protein
MSKTVLKSVVIGCINAHNSFVCAGGKPAPMADEPAKKLKYGSDALLFCEILRQ